MAQPAGDVGTIARSTAVACHLASGKEGKGWTEMVVVVVLPGASVPAQRASQGAGEKRSEK